MSRALPTTHGQPRSTAHTPTGTSKTPETWEVLIDTHVARGRDELLLLLRASTSPPPPPSDLDKDDSSSSAAEARDALRRHHADAVAAVARAVETALDALADRARAVIGDLVDDEEQDASARFFGRCVDAYVAYVRGGGRSIS